MLDCYYGNHEAVPTFQRRVFWRLDVPKASTFILVHYLDEKGTYPSVHQRSMSAALQAVGTEGTQESMVSVALPVAPVSAASQLPPGALLPAPAPAPPLPLLPPGRLLGDGTDSLGRDGSCSPASGVPAGLVAGFASLALPSSAASLPASASVSHAGTLGQASPAFAPGAAGSAALLAAAATRASDVTRFLDDGDLAGMSDADMAQHTDQLLSALVMKVVELAANPELDGEGEGEGEEAGAAVRRGILASLLAPDDAGSTLLHYLASYGLAALIPPLVAAGGHVDTRNGMGCTPLLMAAQWGQPAAAAALLELDADVNAVDADGQNCATLARLHGHATLAQALAHCVQQAGAPVEGPAAPSPTAHKRPRGGDWAGVVSSASSGVSLGDLPEGLFAPTGGDADGDVAFGQGSQAASAPGEAGAGGGEGAPAQGARWAQHVRSLCRDGAGGDGSALRPDTVPRALSEALRRLPAIAEVGGGAVRSTSQDVRQSPAARGALLTALSGAPLMDRVAMHLALPPGRLDGADSLASGEDSALFSQGLGLGLGLGEDSAGAGRVQLSPILGAAAARPDTPGDGGSVSGVSVGSGRSGSVFDEAQLGITDAQVRDALVGAVRRTEQPLAAAGVTMESSLGRLVQAAGGEGAAAVGASGMTHADAVKALEWMSSEERVRVTEEVGLIQKNVRAWLMLRNYRAMRGAVRALQATVRGALARRRYNATRNATRVVQARFRARQAKEALRKATAALVIQRSLREYLQSATAAGGEGGDGEQAAAGGRKRGRAAE